MREVRYTLNPFKSIRNSVIYLILEKNSERLYERVFCVEKSDKVKFKELLKEYEKRGIIELKKHKTWFQNFRKSDKYTKINGEIIQIVEYEFTSKLKL